MNSLTAVLAALLATILTNAAPTPRLNIPSVDLNESVVLAPLVYHETHRNWSVPDHQVGRLEGLDSNPVLVGHNPGVFSPLLDVDLGDEVVYNNTTYVVNQRVVTERPDTSWLTQELPHRLTLLTCLGEQRLVIVAMEG